MCAAWVVYCWLAKREICRDEGGRRAWNKGAEPLVRQRLTQLCLAALLHAPPCLHKHGNDRDKVHPKRATLDVEPCHATPACSKGPGLQVQQGTLGCRRG